MTKTWKRYMSPQCLNLWSSTQCLNLWSSTTPDPATWLEIATWEGEDRGEAFVDMPGMVMVGRSLQTMDVAGLKLTIPSEDLRAFYDIVRETRNPEGKTSLCGFTTTVLLDDDEVDILICEMERVLPEGDRLAEKESEEFRQRMNSIRAESPISVESWKENRAGGYAPNVPADRKRN